MLKLWLHEARISNDALLFGLHFFCAFTRTAEMRKKWGDQESLVLVAPDLMSLGAPELT